MTRLHHDATRRGYTTGGTLLGQQNGYNSVNAVLLAWNGHFPRFWYQDIPCTALRSGLLGHASDIRMQMFREYARKHPLISNFGMVVLTAAGKC